MSLPFIRFQGDFSGINGKTPLDRESLFIEAVYHQAFVDVNEEGTEAAAATAIAAAQGCGPAEPVPIPVFRADHPFLFLVRDNLSGSILFLGRVLDPKG